MAAASPKITPKRKRGEDLWLSPIKFSFVPPTASTDDDGSNSPRSSVARKFRGLVLESGGGAASDDSDAIESLRKRPRPDDVMLEAPQPDAPQLDAPPPEDLPEDAPGSDVKPVLPLPLSLSLSPHKAAEDPVKPPWLLSPGGGGLNRAYPSINRLADSKSRVKKRTGSPPLRLKKMSRRPDDDDRDATEAGIVDPVRAALTWHEDEITMYDPEDEDDDGTGINGIGFKPTPALAQARAMKRRQQMAEYRKREESDARAKRSRRRRAAPEATGRSGEESPSRKVRFMDAEAQNIAITTG
ncbi:hypothetical protein AK830_g2286 [Neonectria ditissima]|uniref:Uncharacterized protein n=1 Tax=Neonectria ditissima TaxID=78410 RepID=A0A0P7BV10_9HYPO|nr:hypothetical protein AK830_g2286 [Neonectria ditissima]